MKLLKKHNYSFIVMLLTLVGIALHFYNLNWGAPFYFHPDERNIASAVSQLQFPSQMNPHFFAYGSLPIYIIYFTGVVANYFTGLLQQLPQTQLFTVSFENSIIVGRAYSALFSTLLIPLLYLLGKRLKDKKIGLLASFLGATSVGFIQFAHFGTFEMWLTFLGTILFGLCLSYFNRPNISTLLFVSLIAGALVSIKVTSLALFPLPVALLIFRSFTHTKQTSTLHIAHAIDLRASDLHSFITFLKNTLFFAIIAALVYLITNPFVFLDQKDFLSSMHYESAVALGTEPVFYTGGFLMTIPLLYQTLHVFPFILNPLILILLIPASVFVCIKMFKHKDGQLLLLIVFFLILLVSQVFLFVKWTRYMMPTLPFIYLIVAYTISSMLEKMHSKPLRMIEMACLVVICSIFAFSYFKTAFINTDSRIAALTFAQHTIPLNATILSEPADLGVLPFQDAFPHVDAFNFYELDNNSIDATETLLQQKISDAQYIVLPSQRILQPRLQHPTLFPKSYVFYNSLINGTLGYHKIYETPCDIFCEITYLGDPVFWWEQTVSVFDRPTVFIYKKNS